MPVTVRWQNGRVGLTEPERPKAARGPPQAPLVTHYVMRLRNATLRNRLLRNTVLRHRHDVEEDYVMTNIIT